VVNTIDYFFAITVCVLDCLLEIEPSNTSSVPCSFLSVHLIITFSDLLSVCESLPKKHVVDYLVGGPPCTMVALILLSDRLSFCLFGTVSYLSGFYYLNYYSPIEGK